jgi:hypothetical protein
VVRLVALGDEERVEADHHGDPVVHSPGVVLGNGKMGELNGKNIKKIFLKNHFW